jgi:sugar/nucleoside kinase (ribokinase family)
MSVDVLILNTATVDFRRGDFDFAGELAGPGGLAKCRTGDMPAFSQQQFAEWIEAGFATVGGPGNAAPLIAKAGLRVAVAVELGPGRYGGLDIQGRFFVDQMTASGVDVSAAWVHPRLPTGTTFVHQRAGGERGGLAYFPNANNDFDFEKARRAVERLVPRIVYYMYLGLSDGGDANGGGDLAAFLEWCTRRGIVSIFDSHTLAGNPAELIKTGSSVKGYELLEPVLPHADIFFASSDEAAMMENTLGPPHRWEDAPEEENLLRFLDLLGEKGRAGGSALYGVTVRDGAYEKYASDRGKSAAARKIRSRFMAGGVVDLVGAGDAFRAGLVTYISQNIADFRSGSMDPEKAVQMGNLFASLWVKSPLKDRYGHFRPFGNMLSVVESRASFASFNELIAALA